MKLLNRGFHPRYSQLAKCSVRPGKTTRELDAFTKAFDSVLELSKGFEIILSKADVSLLARLCSKYLVPLVSCGDEDLRKMAGIDQLVGTLSDPNGTKSIEEAFSKRRAAIQRIRAEAIRQAEAREARIQAESNYIGPDGNPVPHVDVMASSERMKDVKPVRHDEMSTDLKSVIENNLAIMTTASGQPIRNDPKAVVAEPGGTPVPTDPKYYQNLARKTVPGQPDLPKVNNA